MNKLLKEFLSYILVEAESASSKQAKKMGLKNITGPYWSQSGQSPATHKSEGDKIVPISKKDDQPDTTKAYAGGQPTTSQIPKRKGVKKSGLPSTQQQVDTGMPSSILSSTQNLPGAKGVLDAIVGITEKGSAGAGTKESRAAEASVVLIVNNLLEKRKTVGKDMSIDEFMSQNDAAIDAFILQLSKLPKSAIKPNWHNPIKRQVVGTMSEIEKRYGKITEVIWDNKEGRDKFGIKKEEGRDRSDLYVKLENGEIVGVSLKKDGNVFLANQGYEKIMRIISQFSKSEETKKKIQSLQLLHKSESDKALKSIVSYANKNKNSLKKSLLKLKRTDIKDVESDDYNKFFDPKTNTILPNVVDSILNGDLKGDKVKLFTKSLGVLAKTDSKIDTLLTNLRQVDNAVTYKLIDTMNQDSDMNETIKAYMLDVLDMPQMLSTDPFPGVSRVVTVYGAGNVDENGNSTALFTDGSTLRDTFGFDEGLSQEEMTKQLSDKFIIDAEKDSRVGYIRLKTKNPSPPPAYFYPTVASLGVRARGLGSPGVFELYQQNAWTFTLANKNPNPESWTPAQRKTHAKDTLKFLERQLANDGLSDSDKSEIQKDIDFYKGIK